MRLTTITAGLVASLALISAPLAAADSDHDTMADKNAKALNDVPMKVRDALLKEADGREISKVDRHEDNGKVVYDAKIKREGKENDLRLKLDEDGKVVWRSDNAGGSQSGIEGDSKHAWNDTKNSAKKAGDDVHDSANRHYHHPGDENAALTLGDLPQPARDAFKREAGDHQVRDLDRETKHGKTVYEGEVDLGNGKQREITVDEDGKVLKSKIDD